MIVLGLSSIIVIFAMTFTIGKYWIEIYEKYQEKKELDKELGIESELDKSRPPPRYSTKPNRNPFNSFKQNNYDFNELEKELLNN